MSYALRTRAGEGSTDRRLACGRTSSDRDCLLDAARRAGLEPNHVIRLAEALTGRSWDRCGRPEIRVVAWALLDALRRAASGPSDGAQPCAG